MITLSSRFVLGLALAALAITHEPAFATHAPGHADPDPYNCTVLVEKPNGRVEEEQLGKMDCILHKLDRIERRMGCPLEDYLAGECPYSPADTTATFCISQGREGGVDVEFGAEANADYKLGVGWPNVGWAEAIGNVEHPVILPPFIPIPTELNLTGAASLGRNMDICIEVPLIASEVPGPVELISDAEVIDRVLRQINEPAFPGAFEKSKFQRRLGRLANYAIVRVPGTNRFQLATIASDQTALAAMMDDDGESEFDLVENAIDRLMSGEFELPTDGGPLALLKSPIVQDLAMVLEIPAPARTVLADPDRVIGRMFEFASLPGGAGVQGQFVSGAAFCDRIGLNGELRARFPSVDNFCGLLSSLPSFGQTTGIFDLVARLPSLSDIESALCVLAVWDNCEDD